MNIYENMDEAVRFLLGGEDLGTPGSLYGSHASDCAPVAYVLALVIADNTESEMGTELLDYCMGLVVNSHDDVESLLSDHAGSVGWEFDADTYEVYPMPGTPHSHIWGGVEYGHLAGTPHRKCQVDGCNDIRLTVHEDD